MPVVRSFYVIPVSGCTSFNELCIASMVLLMHIVVFVAYIVNVFGMFFLSRLVCCIYIFVSVSLSSTLA